MLKDIKDVDNTEDLTGLVQQMLARMQRSFEGMANTRANHVLAMSRQIEELEARINPETYEEQGR